MKNSLLVPLLLILTALISSKNEIRADANRFIMNTKLVIDTSRYAIFPVQKVPDTRFNYKNNIELSAGDLATVDNKLNEFVTSYNSKAADTIYIKRPKKYYIQPRYILRLERYNRQCAGFIDGDGRKIILVNCVCDNARGDWRRNFLIVKGGGACYFHILVDITNNVVIESGINAPK